MARKKNTSIYVAALLLFLGGVGYLAYSGFSENSVYFLNVAEAKAATPDKLTAARLFGTVASRGIEKHRGGPGVTFSLEDKDNASQTIVVNYSGAVPDTFKAGAEVIVEGGMGPGGRFAAKTLMTKCPSKYQKENRTS
ncbi:MAG: cytochrome c maturation protein CcmE [Desulfovibrio sp.]|uniref:cytochrome c maturation protein CcmE n=1 Tax=Desulfovibrio sp. TaxID=885 RepID=UPI0025C2B6FC|nr:cytochrome c maturation protein CcmE [Desulfovibrio sp.]MBS6828692.1 cytochrome c maturation protein CcmE [Desulfovibrio sp.]